RRVQKRVGFRDQGGQGNGHEDSSQAVTGRCLNGMHLSIMRHLKAAPFTLATLRIVSMPQALRFFGWPLLVGVLVALLLIQRNPEWVGLPRNDVQVVQAPIYSRLQDGPVSYADAVDSASPAVANLYTAKLVSKPAHPLFEDPTF